MMDPFDWLHGNGGYAQESLFLWTMFIRWRVVKSNAMGIGGQREDVKSKPQPFPPPTNRLVSVSSIICLFPQDLPEPHRPPTSPAKICLACASWSPLGHLLTRVSYPSLLVCLPKSALLAPHLRVSIRFAPCTSTPETALATHDDDRWTLRRMGTKILNGDLF